MAQFAVAAKPAILVALGGIALGALGWALHRGTRRRARAEGLLPPVDVAAWNATPAAP